MYPISFQFSTHIINRSERLNRPSFWSKLLASAAMEHRQSTFASVHPICRRGILGRYHIRLRFVFDNPTLISQLAIFLIFVCRSARLDVLIVVINDITNARLTEKRLSREVLLVSMFSSDGEKNEEPSERFEITTETIGAGMTICMIHCSSLPQL
jgi:hypothetical protein